MIDRVMRDAAGIVPPAHLAKAFESYRAALRTVKPAFAAYAGKLSKIIEGAGKSMDRTKLREMHPGLAAAELERVKRVFGGYQEGRRRVLRAIEVVQSAVMHQQRSAGSRGAASSGSST